MSEGLILDLTRLLPGPLAGRILAELGYRVLHLVPPGGDPTAAAPEMYHWLNWGKQEEELNLKSPAGVERLKSLVPEAVALLETNRAGVMEKLGVGPEVLLAINPNLTYIRLASFRGEKYAKVPGHDLAYLAAGGLLERFEGAWQKIQIADTAGAFWGAIATLRGISSGGGFYEVFLAEAPFALGFPEMPMLDGNLVCYSVYPARQGQVVLVGLEPHLWQGFCSAVGHPEWLGEGFSPAEDANPVYSAVKELLASKTAAEWDELAAEQGLPLRAVQSYALPERILPWRYSRPEKR